MALFDLSMAGNEQLRLSKRDTIHKVVSGALQAGSKPDDLRIFFPQGKNAWFVINGKVAPDAFRKQVPTTKQQRFFMADDELFHLDGKTYALSNQWG